MQNSGARPAEALPITQVRRDFLKIAEAVGITGPRLVSKDSRPVAAVIGIRQYEAFLSATRGPRGGQPAPALIILGAKPCERARAEQTLSIVNRLAANPHPPFSKIIFVYGKDTAPLARQIRFHDVRAVKNEKTAYPLIASVKCALGAFSPDDTHFILAFLSGPLQEDRLRLLSNHLRNVPRGKGIAVLRQNGRPTHPVAFAARYKKYFISTRKELGIPYLLKKFHKDISYLEV
ncbi:MAG TPA: NTP transferase domain-containing protein [Elusimicrobiota bacterium]|nr:NTP transferase domain-containing protein [Elusimicrobiota bacterium]